MELILYLEPTTKPFVDCVNDFISGANRQSDCCVSTAIKYHCHVTMTGFFHVNDIQQLRTVTAYLDRILESRNTMATILAGHPAPTVDHTPVLVRRKAALPQQFVAAASNPQRSVVDDMPVHLLLPVSVPSVYHDIVDQFASEFTEIRPKAINHISLAYWDEPDASETETAKWYRAVLEDHWMDVLYGLAKNTFKDCPSPKEWDIVLYERVQKSKRVGVPHEFVEQKRWRAAPLR